MENPIGRKRWAIAEGYIPSQSHGPEPEMTSTKHLRFNDLQQPEPVPRDTDYASVIESYIPIVVQHTRLDSRQSANALLSTVAYAEPE